MRHMTGVRVPRFDARDQGPSKNHRVAARRWQVEVSRSIGQSILDIFAIYAKYTIHY